MKFIKQLLTRREIIALFLILFFGFIVRLYEFNAPIADWHAWRQADTSAVSKNFVKMELDVFHPRFNDLSNVPSAVHDNPQGFRFVEFPFYNLAQASLFNFLGILTIEEWGRIVTIISSLISTVFIYLIVKKYVNYKAGLASAFFFAFIPFNIYYGRIVLPDSSTVAAFLGTIYFFDRWLDEDARHKIYDYRFVLALILSIVAFLLKPFAGFFLLPIVYLSYEKFGINFIRNTKLWIFAVLSLLPFFLWRIWMLQYPGGIPQSGWLINGSNIMFKGAFFQWIFAERVGKLILGYWGLPLLVLGILFKLPKKTYYFFILFLISSLLYVFIVATGNVQHDYYQILIMPSIVIYLALGFNFLWDNKSNIPKPISLLVMLICILFMLSFGWYSIRDYYNIQHQEIIRAGKRIDKLIPQDAKVVIPDANGDTTALYFMDRQGWSSFSKPLPELIKVGADYMVFFNPKPSDFEFGSKYKVVESSSDFLLFNLREKP